MENQKIRVTSIKKLSDEAIISKLNIFRGVIESKGADFVACYTVPISGRIATMVNVNISDLMDYGVGNIVAFTHQAIRFMLDRLNHGEEITDQCEDDKSKSEPSLLVDDSKRYNFTLNACHNMALALMEFGSRLDTNHKIHDKPELVNMAITRILHYIYDNNEQFIEFVKNNPLVTAEVSLNMYQSLRYKKMMNTEVKTPDGNVAMMPHSAFSAFIMQEQMSSAEDIKKAFEFAKSYTTINEVLKAWRKRHKQLLSCFIGEDEKQYLEYMLLSNTINYRELKEYLYSGKKGE